MSNEELKYATDLHRQRMKEKGYYYIPCKIGDTAYVIRRFHNQKRVRSGVISEIFFDSQMEPQIRVYGVGGGTLGKEVFLSRSDAEKKIIFG